VVNGSRGIAPATAASTFRMAATTVLRLEGRDVLDLLHRVTTNRLDDLAPGAARGTLFCDFRGRLLHRAVVARTGDAVWLVRDDAPSTPRLVRAPGDVPLRVGPVADAPPASSDRARARVRAGRPVHGHEIVDAFTPFEVNLAHEVHLDKGCYTGQETLQRLVTYDSVRRRLAWVGGAGAPPDAPADLEREGARVGRLTSVVEDGPTWVGLAVVAWDLAGPAGVSMGGAMFDRLEPVPLQRPLGRAWAVAG